MRVEPATACASIGRLEYVVESRQGGEVERWFVVRPHAELAPALERQGMALSRGCRLVVEARSLRPVGVLEASQPPVPSALGYNPYFDVLPT